MSGQAGVVPGRCIFGWEVLGMGYKALEELPELVRRANELTARMGFEASCAPEVGRLLRVLAGSVQRGTIGEIGSGCGVGAAWLASGLRPGVRFVTVEIDRERAEAVGELFSWEPGVRVIWGDWRLILEQGPFALLFADAKAAKAQEPEALVGALQPGGVVLLDDLTPEDQWPEEWRGKPDEVREFWLNHPHLVATELLIAPGSAVILAVLKRGPEA